MDKVERLNLGLTRKMSFLSLLEQELAQYFIKEYLSMKELMNKQGIVNDVFNEIGKYLDTPDNFSLLIPKATTAYELMQTYYTFKPFSIQDYLRVASRCMTRADDIPYLLLPGIKKNIIYKKESAFCIGHQIYDYYDFIITYSYKFENIFATDDYLLDNKNTDYGLFAPYNISMYKYDTNKQYEGLLHLLDKCVTLVKKEDFDFVNFIVANKITDITQIVEILSHFDNENMFIHMMNIVETYKNNKSEK